MKIAGKMVDSLGAPMKSPYVESSFVLAWLLGEQRAEARRSLDVFYPVREDYR